MLLKKLLKNVNISLSAIAQHSLPFRAQKIKFRQNKIR